MSREDYACKNAEDAKVIIGKYQQLKKQVASLLEMDDLDKLDEITNIECDGNNLIVSFKGKDYYGVTTDYVNKIPLDKIFA